MKRKRAKPVFKDYTMGQIMLLPTNLDELIPENHLVRVVNEFVERMDLSPLKAKYVGGGTSSYHPKMMLKVYLYAYSQKIFSSRRIAKAIRESIPFMWLSGNNRPDFRTVNHFRGHILKETLKKVFSSLLELLAEKNYIKLEDYFLDGTKVEANANRYTFVWAKNTERYQQRLAEKVKVLFEKIDQINAEEDARYGDRDLEEMGEAGPIDPGRLAEQVSELNNELKEELGKETEEKKKPSEGGSELPLLSNLIVEKVDQVKQQLEDDPENKMLKKVAHELEQECLPRARKYEEQREKLAGRNSYSKTDPGATFMRMKDDHMRNGQLKPSYNIQVGTENQFVIGYSVHQEAGDTSCLIPHLERLRENLGYLPAKVSSDAGYGSEENYAYLEEHYVGNYLKYNTFHKELKKNYRPDPFKAENMRYNPELDEFICPNGKRLRFHHTTRVKSRNGYLSERRVYESEGCLGCVLKERCTRVAENRRIKVGFHLWRYRQQARENLLSPEGQRLRSRRGVEVETVFGRIKECWGFRRFFLRGLEKVDVEWGLLCMAHNLAKVESLENEKRLLAV